MMSAHPTIPDIARARRHWQQLLSPFSPIKIPIPVTCCLLLAHLVIFFRPGPLRKLLPPASRICEPSFQGLAVNKWLSSIVGTVFLGNATHLQGLAVNEWLSSIVAIFFHSNVTHLIIDFILLLGAGLSLEQSLGSLHFAATLATLEGLSQWTRFVISGWLGGFSSHLKVPNCVVGCSSAFFALKVVLEKHFRMYSLPPLMNMSTWVGLFVVYAFVPGTSAMGHVCGIMAGYAYVRLDGGLNTFQGTTMMITQTCLMLLSKAIAFLRNPNIHTPNRQRQREHMSTVIGSASDRTEAPLQWTCLRCNTENGVFIHFCDICGAPRSAADLYVPSAPVMQTNGTGEYR